MDLNHLNLTPLIKWERQRSIWTFLELNSKKELYRIIAIETKLYLLQKEASIYFIRDILNE